MNHKEKRVVEAPTPANFVANEPFPSETGPSCSFCGAMMVVEVYRCKSCGCSTSCENSEAPREATPGFDEATEKRWQNAIYELCKKVVGTENDHLIDGGGTDSGDALEFTLCEISQAIEFAVARAASSTPQPTPEIVALGEIRAVACGETQLECCEDDTDALAWIFRRANDALQELKVQR